MRLAAIVIVMIGASSARAARVPCVVPAAPPPAPVVLAAPACHRPPAAVAAKLRAQVRHDYQPARKVGHGDIEFACDGLGAQVVDIVIETGSGHGGSLDLWHAQRRPDGRWDTRGILYHGGYREGRTPPIDLAAGAVALADSRLEIARAALTGTVHEVDPPTDSFDLEGFGSSNDFHLHIVLTDSDGRVVERRFTGYESDDGQASYLGLRIARDALAPLTSIPGVAGVEPGAADRALFAARFVAEAPHFDDEFNWWVMEREVALAGELGTPATLPGLLSRLTFATLDRSHQDARKDALAAIAAITGWDARAAGKSDGEVARDYLAACRPAP